MIQSAVLGATCTNLAFATISTYCNLLLFALCIYKWECLPWDPKVQHWTFYRTQVSLGSNLWVRLSLTQTERPFADLTDVTLANEDTNPILTDNANRTFQGNLATRVTQPGGQIWNQAMQVT